MDRMPPAWLKREISHFFDILRLWNWDIQVAIRSILGSNEKSGGQATSEPRYRKAWLEFRDDITSTPEWIDAVVHELLHVKHSEIDFLVETIIEQLPESARAIADELYDAALDRFIAEMAHIVYELDRDLRKEKAKVRKKAKKKKGK